LRSALRPAIATCLGKADGERLAETLVTTGDQGGASGQVER
jgi:hypothetical protein